MNCNDKLGWDAWITIKIVEPPRDLSEKCQGALESTIALHRVSTYIISNIEYFVAKNS